MNKIVNEKKEKKRVNIALIVICILLVFNVIFAIYISGFDWHTANVFGSLSKNKKTNQVIEGVISRSEKKEDWDYFDNTVMVGDSITYGMAMYGYLNYNHVFAKIGLSQGSALTSKCVYLSKTDNYTIQQAVARAKPGRIIVTLGINAIYSSYSDSFYDNYQSLIDKLKIASPDSVIIIQSIFPVTEKWARANRPDCSTRVADANERLSELATENDCAFLYTYEDLADEYGNMKPEYSQDGLHLSSKGYQAVFDYILTHPVDAPDMFTEIGAIQPPVQKSSYTSQVTLPDIDTSVPTASKVHYESGLSEKETSDVESSETDSDISSHHPTSSDTVSDSEQASETVSESTESQPTASEHISSKTASSKTVSSKTASSKNTSSSANTSSGDDI